MTVKFGMEQSKNLDGRKRWLFGYMRYNGISYEGSYWLRLWDDEDWSFLGKNNLQAMLNAQRDQLRVVEEIRQSIDSCIGDVETVDRAFAGFDEAMKPARTALESIQNIEYLAKHVRPIEVTANKELLQDAIWYTWDEEERKRWTSWIYSSDVYNFQDASRHYDKVIGDIKAAIAKLEEVIATSSDNGDTPPVLPWLRTDGHFQKGDEILGWEEARYLRIDLSMPKLWTPCRDVVLLASDRVVWPFSGFLRKEFAVESPLIMLVWEAKYYLEHDSYRQSLLEKIERPKIGSSGFYEILAAIGQASIFDFIAAL